MANEEHGGLTNILANKKAFYTTYAKYNQLKLCVKRGFNTITLDPPDDDNHAFVLRKFYRDGKPRWAVWNPHTLSWWLQEATSGLFPKLSIYVDLFYEFDEPVTLELSYLRSGSNI